MIKKQKDEGIKIMEKAEEIVACLSDKNTFKDRDITIDISELMDGGFVRIKSGKHLVFYGSYSKMTSTRHIMDYVPGDWEKKLEEDYGIALKYGNQIKKRS